MNPFEVLGLDARPLVEPEVVAEARRRWMERHHPDKSGDGAEAAVANEAARRLRTPGAALGEFLRLQGRAGETKVQAVPGALGDLFMELAGPMGEADRLLAEAEGCVGVLERAGLAEPALEVLERLQAAGARVEQARAETLERLRDLDVRWLAGERDGEALGRVAVELAFLERWSAQASEQAFALAGLAA